MMATPIHNAISVISNWNIGDQWGLETTCLDYDAFKALPKAVEYDGRQYSLTGWNSDTGRACYKTGLPLAIGVDK
jgi:hypothetical protein